MANEFVAKNGLISQNNTTVNGSLIVTGSTTSTLGFTGSLFGTASWSANAISASQVTTNNDSAPVIMYLTYVRQTGSLVSQPGVNANLSYNPITNTIFATASQALTASFALNAGSTFSSTSSIIGNGTLTTWNINHGFNTRNLHITVYESSSNGITGNGETVYPDIRRINANTASIIFANPPTSNQYIVYISQ
jgi:hypothetical protein